MLPLFIANASILVENYSSQDRAARGTSSQVAAITGTPPDYSFLSMNTSPILLLSVADDMMWRKTG